MKKSLLAVAVVAALPAVAFAQSTVTLSGNLDFAVGSFSGTQQVSRGSSVQTTQAVSSTSVINISAVEDLGGGMKLQAWYGLDPRALANDNIGAKSSFNRDELYVGAVGPYGRIRLGSPNSLGLEAHLDSQPLGTGIGSGYGPVAGGQGMTSIVNTRYDRSLRYDTPSLMGFSGGVLYVPGNDRARDLGTATTLGQPASPSTNLPDNRPGSEFALKYNDGPLNASLTVVRQETDKNANGLVSPRAIESTQATLLAGNYKIADTTVYAGYNTGERLTAAVKDVSARNIFDKASSVNSKGYRLAVKHDIGAISLIAAYTTNNVSDVGADVTRVDGTTRTADTRWKTTGLRADYNFSKLSRVYFGYEKYDTGYSYGTNLTGTPTGASDSAGSTGNRSIFSVGLKQSF